MEVCVVCFGSHDGNRKRLCPDKKRKLWQSHENVTKSASMFLGSNFTLRQTTSHWGLYWARKIWTPCLLELSGSASGWPGTIIPSSTFPVNFSILLTCCPECQCSSVVPVISVAIMRWSVSSNQSLQRCLLLSSIYRNTMLLKLTTPHAPRLWLTARLANQRSTILNHHYLPSGMPKTPWPSTITSSFTISAL